MMQNPHYDVLEDKGPKGDKGDTGSQGIKGDKGDTGSKGPKGDKGDTGSKGPKGDKGDTGSLGPQGPKGDKGDKGDTGAQGPAGTLTNPTADVSFGNHKITNLGNPTDEADALNRRYADTRYLRSGQNINLGSNSISSSFSPNADNDLVNKAYVESVRIKIKEVCCGVPWPQSDTELRFAGELIPGGNWLFFLIKYTKNSIKTTKLEVMVGADKTKTISLPEMTINITSTWVHLSSIKHLSLVLDKIEIYYI